MKLIKSKLGLLIVLVISIALIFYKFNLVPKNLTFDEVEFAKLALSLGKIPYTPYSNLATGHSTLYFYIILFSFKLFGVNNFALRFPSAFFGVLSLITFYLIMEKVSDKIKKIDFTLILSVLFITSRWYFNFARFSFEVTFLTFLELMSILFLITFLGHLRTYAVAKANKHNLILSGLFAGLAFNSYTPGRIFFILPLLFLLIKLLKTFDFKKALVTFSFFVIPFIILALPLSLYLANNKDARLDNEFFLKNTEMTVNEKVAGLWHNVSSTALMFNVKGDINGRHNYPGKPALNYVVGALFIIGMIISIKDIKKFNNQFFLCYFIISLVPAILTYPWENPNMLRTYTSIPAVIYFVGQTLNLIANLKIFKNNRFLLLAAFAILIAFSISYELRTYFIYQAEVFPSAFETKPNLQESLRQTNFKY